ncbi:TPA: hypothetical protein ACYEM7_004608 [Klebsiella pneumoniae]|uniref:hypothetical protein n=1 Tax=Klebsiella TaxID=570 RepID=UPI0007CC0CDB|nr:MULTISPECIES: hypothetical protein [Klebsiella]HBT3205613.1 hypothetical protein [Klebsiella aerogenes]EIX9630346.1 hypothetical protein [Klebsiella pneumoniae]ELA0172980.1 hypothetical protein [Klebsiella pneumoniae]ELA2227278.1 hypothetical protein [Klebsiella pneumoniae]MBX4839305.1 hypothetical protein [Klebsiella quasipneumoniae]
MRENILNMPHHLRRQRVVTAEQAAMAMAGVYRFACLREFDKSYDPERYNMACSYFRIIQAALNKELSPKTVWTDIGGNFVNAEFYAEDIWSWAIKELSAEDVWYGCEEENAAHANEHVPGVWGEFAGKDTALKLIAGMAIALEKAGGKYVRGKKLNKSEVARSVSRIILEHGDGIDVTDKALTMLIDEALNTYASK